MDKVEESINGMCDLLDSTFTYINPNMEEPTDEDVAKERKAAFAKSTVKTLKEQHKVKLHDFFHNLDEYCQRGKRHLPDFVSDYFEWVRDYIDILEKKNEELEKGIKTQNEKKYMYRVEVIYEHDMDTEHRQVYFGPDIKRARKEYMEYFDFFDTTGDELYYFPLEEVIGSREEQRKYTGLELQQKFLDMFNQHIRENKSIDFCCDCDNFATECGQDVGDGLVGCKVDILEV
jgi:hypothetical protein